MTSQQTTEMFAGQRKRVKNVSRSNLEGSSTPKKSRRSLQKLPTSPGLFITPRRIPRQNIVTRLCSREIHSRKARSHFHCSRQLYTNIFPNFTVVNVEKPSGFLRKFSPDGRHFIAFSADQTSLEIYEFCGSSAAEELIKSLEKDAILNNSYTESSNVRQQLFAKFFKVKHVTAVASNGEQLNRECSLFTSDGEYVIVGSAVFLPEDPHPPFYQIYTNNEAVSPNARSPLEDYSLHVVEIETGRLVDSKRFKCDKIFLSHNQGLYLYKDILAVLSVQQQLIHIFHISSAGCFTDVRTIGRFCHEDDQLLLSQVDGYTVSGERGRPFREKCINSLKHRVMVFLHKRARCLSEKAGSQRELLLFYRYFDQFTALRLWKMQLLDEDHLLIKYASEEVVTLRVSDPNSQPSFFVVYNMRSTEVLAVYENTSEELLNLFEKYCDLFRNAGLECENQCTSLSGTNIYARQIHQRFKETIIHAKFGGHTEAMKRLLSQLPISAQSYSCSPYLDLTLYSYDDKWVSVMERPKACGDHPIRFYARDSGLLKFKIHAGPMSKNPPPAQARRLVAFTFHPIEPFAISVQRTNAEYVVNFHLRHLPT